MGQIRTQHTQPFPPCPPPHPICPSFFSFLFVRDDCLAGPHAFHRLSASGPGRLVVFLGGRLSTAAGHEAMVSFFPPPLHPPVSEAVLIERRGPPPVWTTLPPIPIRSGRAPNVSTTLCTVTCWPRAVNQNGELPDRLHRAIKAILEQGPAAPQALHSRTPQRPRHSSCGSWKFEPP